MPVLTAVIHKKDNTFVAEYHEVGTASQGKTIEEAAKTSRKRKSSIGRNFH
ncbi:MAG: type II toxin-antitoxin system HicB family antitoxin [Methanothrix sp.]